MSYDAHTNFAYAVIGNPPIPAQTGTSLSITPGLGAIFPVPPFNATIWPTGVNPLTTNAEIVRVTARVGDTFTITRTQEGSGARAIASGDQIAATITVKTLTDVETAVTAVVVAVADVAADLVVLDAEVSGFTPGSVVFGGASGTLAEDNAKLFWDDTNNRLGVGTPVPGKTLVVNGPAQIGAGPDSGYGHPALVCMLYSDADYGGYGYAVTAMASKLQVATGWYAGAECHFGAVKHDDTFQSLYGFGAEQNEASDLGSRDFFIYDYPMTKYRLSVAGDGSLGFGSFASANGSDAQIVIDPSQRVGIGAAPSAVLTIKAGTATAGTAPLKLTTGALLTSPEAGAVEFETDSYYGTTTTGTTRRMFVAGTTGRVTGQVAAVASVATYTVGAADASYEVSANVLVTTATTHNFTVTCAYTDEGNTARVLTLTFSSLAGVLAAAIINTGGTVPYAGVPLHIRCKASTAITIATVGVFTNVVYNCEGVIKQTA